MTRMTENNNINNIKPHKCNLCVNKVNCIAWRKENKLWRRREKNLGHRKTTRVQPISMKVYGVQLYLQLTVRNLIQKPPIMQKRSSWTETLTDRPEKTQEYILFRKQCDPTWQLALNVNSYQFQPAFYGRYKDAEALSGGQLYVTPSSLTRKKFW